MVGYGGVPPSYRGLGRSPIRAMLLMPIGTRVHLLAALNTIAEGWICFLRHLPHLQRIFQIWIPVTASQQWAAAMFISAALVTLHRSGCAPTPGNLAKGRHLPTTHLFKMVSRGSAHGSAYSAGIASTSASAVSSMGGVSTVGCCAAWSFWVSSSTSWRRRNLPIRVLGRLARNSTRWGTL